MINIRVGDYQYEWVEPWTQLPADEIERGWAHPGMAVTASQQIVTCHAGKSEIMFFEETGELKKAWSSGLVEAHGITIALDRQGEHLWISDHGAKANPDRNYEKTDTKRGRVVQATLDGEIRATLPEPPLPVYREGNYSPTSVAVFEERHGGNGDIWVADGYGQYHVHCYDHAGNYKYSLNGAEGPAGLFSNPHAIYITTQRPEPELYIADRRNDRIQVYDLDGNFKRVFGQEFLSRPGGFAEVGDMLVIAELMASVTVVDSSDRLLAHVGANAVVCTREGWPNQMTSQGQVAPEFEPGKFNSPHGIAADQKGNLYIAEWVIGGRIVKLARTAS